jgi:truncated hemoglobin YjbI
MTKIKDLIKQLKQLDQEQYVKVACDEEWNTIFNDIEIEKDGEHGAFIIYGLSGSEEESWEDVVNNKFNREID